jgi:hypothetical protein
MIQAQFRIGGDIVVAIVDGNNLMFGDADGQLTTIEGLKLSKGGVIKEFPDLENNEEWRLIAIQRFKEKVKMFNKEMDKINYIKEDLIKFGYEPLFYQQAGSRTKKWK